LRGCFSSPIVGRGEGRIVQQAGTVPDIVAIPGRRGSVLDTIVPWLFIGLTPVLLGLLSWDTGSTKTPFQNWLRLTGVPVVAVELLLIMLAVRRGFEPWKTIRSVPVGAQAALVILILIAFANAALVASDGVASALRSCMALVHLLFAFSVSYVVGAANEWRSNALWIAIVGGVGAYIVLLALFIMQIPSPGTFDWMHLGLGVINIRHVGFFSAVGAAAALGLASGAAGTRAYLAGLAAASIMVSLSFWAGSRGPIVAVLVAFGLGLVVLPALRSPRAVFAAVASVPAGALLSLMHSVPDPHFGLARLTVAATRSSIAAASSGRTELWAGTWRAILHRPLLGHGEDQLVTVVPEAMTIFHHPHNAILQALFQWGFIGTACLVGLAFLAGRHCLQRVRAAGLKLASPFLVAATLLIMSLHDGALFFGYPLMMVALGLGVMSGAQPAPSGRLDR
jgi:O-antigen ligase